MTPLRRRMLEDMQLRNFSAGTQRSYIHYVEDFARFFNLSPERLGLDDIRNYQLHLTEERRLSPQSINCFVAAAKFLYADSDERNRVFRSDVDKDQSSAKLAVSW